MDLGGAARIAPTPPRFAGARPNPRRFAVSGEHVALSGDAKGETFRQITAGGGRCWF